MAVAFRSLSTLAYGSRTNSTVPAPSGVTDGDTLLLALFVGSSGTPPAPGVPAGWTTIQGPTTQTDAGFNGARRLLWKVASGEPANYTFTHSSASTCAVAIAVSGGDTGAAPLSSSNGRSTGGAAPHNVTTALSIVTPASDSYVVFVAHNWNLYGSASPPTGTTPSFTERQDAGDNLWYVADGILGGTAAATGDKTQSNLNTTVNDAWGAFLVSVAPVQTGGGGGPASGRVKLVSPVVAILARTAGGAADADAEGFFTRAGITDNTQKNAVTQLVSSLKSAGSAWTKMRALYPFVGGTAATHSHNLKNSSYQITWSGTITHDANGVTGVNACYGDTGLNLNTTTFGSGAMGVYRKSSGAMNDGDIAMYVPGTDYHVYPRFGDDMAYLNWGAEGNYVVVASADGKGFWIISRTTETLETGFKNGASIGTNTAAQGGLVSFNLRIFSGYAGGYSLSNIALAFISDGLTSSECASVSAAVETFQTTLGRQN